MYVHLPGCHWLLETKNMKTEMRDLVRLEDRVGNYQKVGKEMDSSCWKI